MIPHLRSRPRRGSKIRLGLIVAAVVVLAAGYLLERRHIAAANVSTFPLYPDPQAAAARSLPDAGFLELDTPVPPIPLGPGRTVDGELAAGERFVEVLERLALDRGDIYAAVAAMGKVLSFRRLRPGHRWEIDLASDGTLAGFLIRLSALDVYRVKRTPAGFEAEREAVEVRTELASLSGEVKTSLWRAVTEGRANASLIPLLTEVFEWDVDFNTETRAGDRFAVVVDKHFVEDQFVRYGAVQAAAYDGTAAGSHRVIPWTSPEGRSGLYDPYGNSVRRAFLKSPLKFTRISSGFTKKRFHPILHRMKAHLGVDYAAPHGTPVRSIGDGKVIFAGWKGGNGKLVSVLHHNGYESHYAHLSLIRKGIRLGALVTQREFIGRVGATGLATGPHLHFGMSKAGHYVNPLTIRRMPDRSLEGADKEAFLAHAVPLTARLDALIVRAGPDGGLPY
jgi:murein DD-endopeptidase MepM/ murein hydrolase activator NlpD